jgi:hypothetical protein
LPANPHSVPATSPKDSGGHPGERKPEAKILELVPGFHRGEGLATFAKTAFSKVFLTLFHASKRPDFLFLSSLALYSI